MASSIRVGSIVRVTGRLVLIESLILLLPMLVCIACGESDWRGFAVAAAAAGATGGCAELFAGRHRHTVRRREGFIITSVIWIVFALFGVIPFMMSARPLGFTDSMFEVISGLTTTGASMMTDVEAQSHGILFWRSLTQWIGGLGIILFMLAVLPELNRASGISMFEAEATGITHDKLHPRIRQTSLSIWGVYVALTVADTILLWAGPMDLFDSVCQAFATIATGGFSTRNAGICYWQSDYVLVVTAVFMFLAGMNFAVMYNVSRHGLRSVARNSVARGFTCVTGVAYVLLLVYVVASGQSRGMTAVQIIVYPVFHVISAITSTGFSISAVEGWGPFALFVTVFLMLCGACAGSTSGGIKIDRLLVLRTNLANELRKTIFPKRTYVVRLNGSALDGSQTSRITAFVSLYILGVVISTGLITLGGFTLTDAFFMVCSCMGCNGLGYGVTGAGGSYAFLPVAVKWLLTAVMLVGRLELFTFLVLFLPSFWRR